MTEYDVKGYVRGCVKLLEKDKEEMDEHLSDLRRDLTGIEYQDYGFLMGRLHAFQVMLELVEGLDE